MEKQFLPRLKILLQSRFFIIATSILLILYILLFTKIITYKSKYDINDTSLSGLLTSYNINGDKLSLTIKGKEDIVANFYFQSEKEKDKITSILALGSKVYLTGNFTKPLNNTIPNTFNYQKYLYNKKIYYVFNASSININSKNISIFYKIKNIILKKVNTYEDTTDYMQAFILGNKNYIASPTYDAFKNNGVTHLFAVSGMHVSFLILALNTIFHKLKIKENIGNFLIASFLFFYMFLIGFTPSVIRASLLYLALLINKKFNLNIPSFNVLYLVFLMFLLLNPFYIYDLGFIYSFLTSFSLIIFSKKITGNYFTKLLKVSTIAFLVSTPITLLNFYEFNLFTIFNNLIIVPLVSLILFPLTLITFIIPFLEPLLNIGFNLLEFINNICNNLSINIVVPKLNIIFLIIYYLLIYLIYTKGFKYTFSIFLLIFSYKLMPYLDSNSYIYFLDVGQGDSSLIITSHQKDVILIDTGGKITYEKEPWQERNKEFNLSTNIITFLKSRGVTKIDLLVLTHGDLDHLGYAEYIIKSIKTKNIMLNNNELNEKETNLVNKAHLIKNNYQSKSINLTNLNYVISKDENTSSLVLYITLKNRKLLIMGDAPKEIEQNIMAKYQLQVDYLKLGHHGSNTSSAYEFLKNINPQYSIISSGRNNRYNHPSPETISNLTKLNLPYFNTQDTGTIEFILKNSQEKIKFYYP